MAVQLLIFTISLLCSLVLSPVMREFARRCGLVDKPDSHRKLHSQSTPLAGGIAVYLTVVMVVCGALVVPSSLQLELQSYAIDLLGLLLGMTVLLVVGIVDDAIKLRGRQKLFGQILAVIVLVANGLLIEQIGLFGYRVELGLLSVPFTMFWILGAINALNLIDGIDGLATSTGIILSMTIAGMALIINQPMEAVLALALAGALVGFLRYNFPPASMFLGDAGSMLIGLLVGVLAIRTSLKGPATLGLAAPLAMWAIPILDSGAAILRRKLTGRSIYTTDRGHLHHSLLSLGWTNLQTLGWISLFAACTAGGALASVCLGSELVAFFSVAAVLAVLVSTKVFGHMELSLLNHRLLTFGKSLMTRPQTSVQQSAFHLQGTREWQQLWQSLTATAEKLNLMQLSLLLNAPSLGEGFFATWRQSRDLTQEEIMVLELPLRAHGKVVGRLEVKSLSVDDASCSQLSDILSLLAPMQLSIIRLLESDAFIHPPETIATSTK